MPCIYLRFCLLFFVAFSSLQVGRSLNFSFRCLCCCWEEGWDGRRWRRWPCCFFFFFRFFLNSDNFPIFSSSPPLSINLCSSRKGDNFFSGTFSRLRGEVDETTKSESETAAAAAKKTKNNRNGSGHFLEKEEIIPNLQKHRPELYCTSNTILWKAFFLNYVHSYNWICFFPSLVFCYSSFSSFLCCIWQQFIIYTFYFLGYLTRATLTWMTFTLSKCTKIMNYFSWSSLV